MQRNHGVRESHPLAGKTVTLKSRAPELNGKQYTIEDWWQNVAGQSWMTSDGNPAAMIYGIRTGLQGGVPTDNEVVYGKVGPFGHLVHVSELGPEVVIDAAAAGR